ncbi:lipase family protein [Pelomonas sp. CA6]|uniref:alpha/beta hydrolase family protein n=1 Tax=Pelomonas sp. CA6 TaxID=2907999 RepID=UPI001F4C48DB|nr:lipase family protein [Pelomonas sp. CA6]MCH7343069.1 lipase family protein [Pelomonas sp. CA6]
MKTRKFLPLTLLALSAAVLTACGGGGDDPTPPPSPTARATVVFGQQMGKASAAEIDAGTQASGLQPISGKAKCGVDVRYVQYYTIDPKNQPVTATTAVLVPNGSDAACSGERPVVLHAHGTTTLKSYNMAQVSSNQEAALMMAMYAAQGFIVVAPNYVGYDLSSLNYHPYLNAEQQAADMVDALRAAKKDLAANSAVKPSSKLLLTGYSQGGHVAMATHKIIERDYASEFTVTASAPMSGPYNLVKMGDVVTGPGPINAGATLFVPLLMTSYQNAYGGLYASPSEVYQAPFDQSAPTLFPTDTPVATLMAQGKLPADPTLTKLFGTGGLLTDGFRSGYQNSNYRKALQTNTLLGWAPKRPMVLCAGGQDPTVFFFNTTDVQADFASRGATVPAWNLENRASMPAGAAFDTAYGGFQLAKAAAGANAQAQYHGGLVPPFCHALARGYFQQVLASGQ